MLHARLPPQSAYVMESAEEGKVSSLPILNLTIWFTKLLSLQADIIYNCLVSLSSPFFYLLFLASEPFHRAEEVKQNVDSAVKAAARVPITLAIGSRHLLRKLILGFLGATYVGIVLMAVMIVAVVLGVGLINMWVEEPVFVRERLYFDYTDVHPNAVFTFGGGGGGFQEYTKKMKSGVPVGHTFYVCLVLLMPESDYNREIGMFQVIAELISTNGNAIKRSSHPCMLQFRSLPIRVMRTFILGIPLLLGITAETQRIRIPMLKHKEAKPRTEAIKISLIPQAGTSFLPQLYEAEILVHSELPWSKELVRSWKWTFYVWTSLYIYIMLLMLLVCCFRPLIFPVMTTSFRDRREPDTTEEVSEEPQMRARDRGVSETLRRWKQSRSKRKAMLLHGGLPETMGSSSASSISVTREDTSATGEDVGDSESACL